MWFVNGRMENERVPGEDNVDHRFTFVAHLMLASH